MAQLLYYVPELWVAIHGRACEYCCKIQLIYLYQQYSFVVSGPVFIKQIIWDIQNRAARVGFKNRRCEGRRWLRNEVYLDTLNLICRTYGINTLHKSPTCRGVALIYQKLLAESLALLLSEHSLFPVYNLSLLNSIF